MVCGFVFRGYRNVCNGFGRWVLIGVAGVPFLWLVFCGLLKFGCVGVLRVLRLRFVNFCGRWFRFLFKGVAGWGGSYLLLLGRLL